jgi:hypothetical protein
VPTAFMTNDRAQALLGSTKARLGQRLVSGGHARSHDISGDWNLIFVGTKEPHTLFSRMISVHPDVKETRCVLRGGQSPANITPTRLAGFLPFNFRRSR